MKPILYTIDGCIKCHRAKQHLIKNDITFLEKNLFIDNEAAIELKELLGEVNTPVFVDGPYIIKGSEILNIKGEGK